MLSGCFLLNKFELIGYSPTWGSGNFSPFRLSRELSAYSAITHAIWSISKRSNCYDMICNLNDLDLPLGYNLTPDAMGRYSCDECGKIFKHPGSLQHHRHIHRGTHRCPSCGKVFSRRWDMERHLNKSKYGCPANRFSTGSAGSGSSGGSSQVTSVALFAKLLSLLLFKLD